MAMTSGDSLFVIFLFYAIFKLPKNLLIKIKMSTNIGQTERDLIQARKNKLKNIIAENINPYPSLSDKKDNIALVLTDFDSLLKSKKDIKIAGRILALRGHGKLVFADLIDEKGKIQLVFKSDVMAENFKLIELLDLGDFIEASGTVFTTNAGEKSVETNKVKLLAKALRPLPEKWHGLTDPETRYRQRYLDLIVNKEAKDKFYARSKIVSLARQFLSDADFIEVETPVLQSIPGGATAKPFKTHYEAYGRDVFLRIAPELYLKRLLVGGFEKVFEFARCFRNEGVDATHNPEFTNLEFYWAYSDYEKMMSFVEDMVKNIVRGLAGEKLILKTEDQETDFSKKFKVIKFAEVCDGKDTDEAFKEGIAKIIEPTFVVNHPTTLIPLAKRNEEDPSVVDSFQLIIGGLEIAKAFSELNDPTEQRKRFEEQMKLKREGDQEAQTIDEEFLTALDYGMPPAAGCGIGIDRLARVLTNSKTIREILFFPFMKPTEVK